MSEAAQEVHLNEPQTLYRHWEESQWSPWDIDPAADHEQWRGTEDRSLVSFVSGPLMVAEKRITTMFSELVTGGAETTRIHASAPHCREQPGPATSYDLNAVGTTRHGAASRAWRPLFQC